MNQKILAERLRELAKDVEAGKVKAVAFAALQVCDKCPDTHAITEIQAVDDPISTSMTLLGAVSCLRTHTEQYLRTRDLQRGLETMFDQLAASQATKQ